MARAPHGKNIETQPQSSKTSCPFHPPSFSIFPNPSRVMYSSYLSFPRLLSILLLTTFVRPHPQLPLPSSGEPPAAFPIENNGFTTRDDTGTAFPFEDVAFGTSKTPKVFPLNGDPTGVEQFLSSTSAGSINYADGSEMSINHPELVPSSDQSSTRSGDENMITSQSNACDPRSSHTLTSERRLRNRDPGQELPSWCNANPNERNIPSEPQTVPGQQPAGTGNRELNEEGKVTVDVPTLDSPSAESDYTGSSTKTRANLEICPPERSYPLCAEDEAISDVPAELAALFTYVAYLLSPAYACTSPCPPFPYPNTLESLVIIGKITIEISEFV